MVIAGAGPAGAATAIGLERAGVEALVFEARGPLATRARNIFLRPQVRGIIEDLIGRDPGRDISIMDLENSLRTVAANEHVPIEYDTRVLGITEHTDHVSVHLQRAGEGEQPFTVEARALVDATGGRLADTNTGVLERVPTTSSHAYVTAQYAGQAPYPGIAGVFDRARSEALVLYPASNGDGFLVYYDLPPGTPVGDGTALLARYDALAGRLNLGEPVTPPQVFDARQHLSRSAAAGHVLKVGDSAGNADPYVGAGVAAAIVDSVAATRVLSAAGDTGKMAREAARHVLLGHRLLGIQGMLMRNVRTLAGHFTPAGHLDETLTPADIRPAHALDLAVNIVNAIPILT